MIHRILPAAMLAAYDRFGILPQYGGFTITTDPKEDKPRCCPETIILLASVGGRTTPEEAEYVKNTIGLDVMGRLHDYLHYDTGYLSGFWTAFDQWFSSSRDRERSQKLVKQNLRFIKFPNPYYPRARGEADGIACAKACEAVWGTVPQWDPL